MSNISLPVELWIEIATRGCFIRKDYCSLVRVNRAYRYMFMPMLYAELTIKLDQTYVSDAFFSNSEFLLAIPSTRRLLDRLSLSESLRSYIRNCHIINGSSDILWNQIKSQGISFQHLVGRIIQLVKKFPKLRSVHLERILVQADWIYELAAIPTLQLSLCFSGCSLTGKLRRVVAYNVISLECSERSIPILYPIIFHGNLQKLKFRSGPGSALIDARTRLTSDPSFLSLRHLSFVYVDSDIMWLLKLTPNLESFGVDTLGEDTVFGDDWKTALPNLKSFRGHSELICHFVTDRPVSHLITWGTRWSFSGRPNLAGPPDCFGSIVPVRALQWGSCDLTGLLGYLVGKNPLLEQLSLKVSREDISERHWASHLGAIKDLKWLRALSLIRKVDFYPTWQSIKYPDVVLGWERTQCEELSAGGCPDLTSFTFPSKRTWNRHHNRDIWVLSSN